MLKNVKVTKSGYAVLVGETLRTATHAPFETQGAAIAWAERELKRNGQGFNVVFVQMLDCRD